MNFFDIMIIILCLLALARGLAKGLVREILSLGSLVLGIFLASQFNEVVAPYIEPYTSTPGTARAAAYLAIFIGTLLLAWLIGRLFRHLAEDSIAGWMDTMLGGLFGLLEGTLACLVLVLLFATFTPSAGFYQNSLLAPRLLPMAAYLGDILPESFAVTVHQSGNSMPVLDKMPETEEQ